MPPGVDWSQYREVFSSPRSANVRALVNSVLISVYSVAGAGVLGTALAYFFFRFDFPLRRLHPFRPPSAPGSRGLPDRSA